MTEIRYMIIPLVFINCFTQALARNTHRFHGVERRFIVAMNMSLKNRSGSRVEMGSIKYQLLASTENEYK